jgi:D-alanyl-lipoteichoic acid acyltransferase DltB (MBOAT superfamily)
MLFTSPLFLVFFAAVLLFCRLPLSWGTKKGFLLLASWAFYAAWNPPFVLLLLFSTVLDFGLGLWMERAEAPARRKALLVASLAANLGVLGFFKYAGLMRETFIEAARALGHEVALAPWSIILPVGISFYTFQTLSYTIDVYRRELRATRSPLDFALFVSFFPQLVAGPIVRAVQEGLPR